MGVFCVLVVVFLCIGVWGAGLFVLVGEFLVCGCVWRVFLGVLRCNKLWVVFLGVGISDGLSLCPCRCVMHLGVISCFRVSKINL